MRRRADGMLNGMLDRANEMILTPATSVGIKNRTNELPAAVVVEVSDNSCPRAISTSPIAVELLNAKPPTLTMNHPERSLTKINLNRRRGDVAAGIAAVEMTTDRATINRLVHAEGVTEVIHVGPETHVIVMSPTRSLQT